MTAQTAQVETETQGRPAGNLVVVDMGSQSKKRIKNLKKGRGKLMQRVDEVVADLQADDLTGAGANVVVVIVKQKTGMTDLFDLDD